MNYLGLDTKKTELVAKELNSLLANYHIYYQNLRNFHWNVDGENFFELHEKFEELYNDARERIDDIAERVLTLRHKPMSRLTDYLEYAEVQESMVLDNDRAMVDILLLNHRHLIQSIRRVLDVAENAKDEGTIDLVGDMLENIEKKSWMMDAWLVKKEELAMS